MSDFLVQDGQTLVFIGDSITDCGRRAESFPYGNGYVRAVIDLITARYPERKIVYFNEGIGGNTVEDLWNRWHDDVLVHNPDWVSVKIGINDLHRHLMDSSVLSPARFEAIYRQCLELTREKTGARLVLISPFYISTDTNPRTVRGRVLKVMPEYIAVVKKLAEEWNALYVPTHEIFQEQLRFRPADAFCPEPVHPYLSGHLVMAHALLKILQW